ncbi:MAG: CPBP family intramembrane metalloprotease [Oscillospiraceae bacterium]|nr:CPBP family intramembrane metalloprotease [Oscillospiraceae bacterium]
MENNNYNPYEITTANNLTAEEAKFQIKQCSGRNSVLLLIFFGFTFLISIIAGLLYGADIISYSVANIISMMGIYVIIVPVCLIIGNKNQKHTTKTYFQKSKMKASEWFKWSCILFTCNIAVNFVFSSIFEFISKLVQNQTGESLNALDITDVASNSAVFLFFNFLAMGICAPVFEELLLRGTSLTHTLPYGQWFSFIVIGVSFGVLHGNFQQMFYASFLGVFLCFIAFKAKSIIPAIGTHMFINLPSAILITASSTLDIKKFEELSKKVEGENYTAEQMKELTDFVIDNGWKFAAIFIVVVFMIVAFIIGLFQLVKKLRYYRDDFECGNTCPVLTNKQKFAAYLSSPVTIMFFVLVIAYAVWYAMQ